MGDKYEVQYWDYNRGKYISIGYFHYFFQAKKVAKKLSKKWYCVSILMRLKK